MTLWDLDDPNWPRESKILMEVLLLEGNSSSFQLNGYCISESKILRRMIFINGSRGERINVLESIRFMSVLWLIFVKNFVLKFKIYFLKYFEIFTLEFTLEKFWNIFSLFKHEKIIRRFRVNKLYLKVLSLNFGSLLNTIDPIKWEFRI